MACISCQNNDNIFNLNTSSPCPDCGCTSVPITTSCTGDTVDSSKVIYTGPNLTCIEVESGATQEEINQALDAKICTELGTDISTLDTACLVNPDSSQLSTISEFIEAASAYMCTTQTGQETVINNFNTFVTNITTLVTEAGSPGITSCGGVGIVPSDTNAQAFVKTANAICSIQAAINPSSANWNNCGFSVGSAPTTILGGFNKVLDYICQVKNLIPTAVSLPTFNNVGSCLPTPLTTTDSLTSTINKIKTKLCALDYDLTGFNFGCIDGATILHDVIQNTMDRVNQYEIYTFDPTYFTQTLTTPDFPCGGKNVTLNSTGLDKKVASNGSDTTPGYLSDKLQAGSGVAFDYSTTPGKVITSATGDHKILVNGSDAAADYLDVKLDGAADGTGALSLTATANGGNSKVIITPTFNWAIVAQNILTAINGSSDLKTALCTITCACACSNARTVVFEQNTGTGLDLYQFRLSGSQNSPVLPLYDSGSVSLTPSQSLSSGFFSLTTVAGNPSVTATITNNGSTTTNFTIVIEDNLNNVVTSSTTTTSSLAPAVTGIYVLNLGTSTDHYRIITNFV